MFNPNKIVKTKMLVRKHCAKEFQECSVSEYKFAENLSNYTLIDERRLFLSDKL